MKQVAIYYSSHFVRVFKKLPHEMQKKALEREAIFRSDYFDPRLKTHKLHGEFSKFWAFSVDYSYRIVFAFRKDGSIGFIDIGPHSIYE